MIPQLPYIRNCYRFTVKHLTKKHRTLQFTIIMLKNTSANLMMAPLYFHCISNMTTIPTAVSNALWDNYDYVILRQGEFVKPFELVVNARKPNGNKNEALLGKLSVWIM